MQLCDHPTDRLTLLLDQTLRPVMVLKPHPLISHAATSLLASLPPLLPLVDLYSAQPGGQAWRRYHIEDEDHHHHWSQHDLRLDATKAWVICGYEGTRAAPVPPRCGGGGPGVAAQSGQGRGAGSAAGGAQERPPQRDHLIISLL
jgi:hypothetical protein